MKNISEHITFGESYKSQIAERFKINNVPPDEVLPAMQLVSKMCFEPMRAKYGALIVSSFFRCFELNKKIGGSKSSQHCKGEAIDVDADGNPNVTNAELFEFAKNNLDFEQLIWEKGDDKNPAWVHISYKAKGNRKQVIKIK